MNGGSTEIYGRKVRADIASSVAIRGKGFEIPDALALLERLDLKGKIVTGDAIFCQKSITAKIAAGGGGYVFPVKDNREPERRYRNGLQRAGFFPCRASIAAS